MKKEREVKAIIKHLMRAYDIYERIAEKTRDESLEDNLGIVISAIDEFLLLYGEMAE